MSGLSSISVVAAAQIAAELAARNQEALARYQFAPGMHVRFIGGPTVHGHAHEVGVEFIVSTVKASGKVFFKGTNGASAYASQLRPVGLASGTEQDVPARPIGRRAKTARQEAGQPVRRRAR